MAVLRDAQSQQEQTSADLDQARQESNLVGKKLETEKRHSEALSMQLKTLHEDLQDSKNLERVAQVQHRTCDLTGDLGCSILPRGRKQVNVFVQTQIQEWKECLSQEQHKHRQDLDAAAAVAEAQIDEIQKGRSREMDDIHAKLKDVLQRKNTTIQRRAVYLSAPDITLGAAGHKRTPAGCKNRWMRRTHVFQCMKTTCTEKK